MKDLLPLTKVLWPTDFSEPADRALEVATKLCSIFSAELIMIHAISPINMTPPTGGAAGFGYPELMEDLTVSAEKSLQEWRQNKVPKDVNSRYQVFTGNPADQIVEVAQTESADIIVIATHGLTGWRRFIFGSVAERVVRLAACPVLTIPAPHDEE
jgi:nucleotide-binding universal stress UspA family protein